MGTGEAAMPTAPWPEEQERGRTRAQWKRNKRAAFARLIHCDVEPTRAQENLTPEDTMKREFIEVSTQPTGLGEGELCDAHLRRLSTRIKALLKEQGEEGWAFSTTFFDPELHQVRWFFHRVRRSPQQ
jgi:hypothetical protein